MSFPLLPLLWPLWTIWAPDVRDLAVEAWARARLTTARSLIVQYQRVDLRRIEQADPDVLILDGSRDGSGFGDWTPGEVARIRRRPDGSLRLVLAYLSVGEAENYRFYWPRNGARPPYVADENPDWPGNFRVRHWTAEWHRVLYGTPASWVDRVLRQGFDGLFLDTVDSCEVWQQRRRPGACDEMGDLLEALILHARSRRPDLVVVANNPWALRHRPGLSRLLTGAMSENRLFREGRLLKGRALEVALAPLRDLRRAGLGILVLEYPRSPSDRRDLGNLCRRERFLCQASTPALDTIGHILWRDHEPGRDP